MPAKILVVDNEPDEVAGWETLLKKAGYLVRSAVTASRALQHCDELIFDLVILDYVMPRMKGLELLARIRKKNRLVRSIIVSGKLDDGAPEKEIRDTIRGEVETDRYLHKPLKNEQLLQAVAEALSENKPNRPWDSVAADYLKSEKESIAKALAAQDKLKSHLRRKK
jgi:CheY-like chemotaxis protein